MVRYDDMGTLCVCDLHPAKAVTQNEYLDFLREIVPATMPLSMALKLREERDHSSDEPSSMQPKEKEQDEEAEDEEEKEETLFESQPALLASDANDVSMDEAGHDASRPAEVAGHVA